MSLSKVIDTARGELGVTELPAGSNCVKYWTDYTGIGPSMQGQPWCVCFLWWYFWKSGESPAFFGGAKTASCGKLLRWYREQGLTVPVEEVQPGNIVLLNFRGGKDPEHCGLVEKVDRLTETVAIVQIVTIEGNTSWIGSQDNGGMVCEKARYPHQIVGVCRPQYKEEPAWTGDDLSAPCGGTSPKGEATPAGGTGEGKDDITGHWAEQSIRRVMQRGFMQGYPDGTFRPEQPVTRAELATVLDRLELEGRLGNA